MAIDTTNEKFAAIVFGRTTDPMHLTVSGGTIEQDDQQQFLWGFPGVLWGAAAVLDFVLDMNTRIMVFLRDFYTVSGGDLSTLTAKYLAEEKTGEYTARMQGLIQDATDATLP